MKSASEIFKKKYKNYYGYNLNNNNKDNNNNNNTNTLLIDKIRKNEFSHIGKIIYLDHAASTLYSKNQIEKSFNHLLEKYIIYGNPHSDNYTGNLTKKSINKVESQIYDFFHTNSKEYTIIFTSGATESLKLIGEWFPWNKNNTFYYTDNCHNSVIGIRNIAIKNNSNFKVIPISNLNNIENQIFNNNNNNNNNNSINLFAFPAECNFTGNRINLEIINKIKKLNNNINNNSKLYVLLDAAKYVATSSIDLNKYSADFITLSFYKIFGYPTGIGALLIKNESINILNKTYYGGGSIGNILINQNITIPHKNIQLKLTDGTLPYLNIILLQYGFNILSDLGMIHISKHVYSLRKYLFNKLNKLYHKNKVKACEIYGNENINDNVDNFDKEILMQGPIIACNFKNDDETYIGYVEINKIMNLNNIQIRTGCFCNPGACQKYLKLTDNEILNNISEGHVCGDEKDIINNKPTGAIRISFGYMSTFEDVYRFLQVIKDNFVNKANLYTPIQYPSTSLVLNNTRKRRLTELIIYPIKSCPGMKVQTWKIGRNGLEFDRKWAIMDILTQKILRLKDEPKLAFIIPNINIKKNTITLNINNHNIEPIMFPLINDNKAEPNDDNYIDFEAKMCGRKKMAMCLKDHKNVSEWLSTFLGRKCVLVQSYNNKMNENNRFNSKLEDQDNLIKTNGFVNKEQFLLLSETSVDHINSILLNNSQSNKKNNVKMVTTDVFRSNFVISDCIEPYEEDKWKKIKIGNHIFDVIGPCSRCSMIDMDPIHIRNNKENNKIENNNTISTLQLLSTYRRDKYKILFGQYLNYSINDANPNIEKDIDAISINDTIEILDELKVII